MNALSCPTMWASVVFAGLLLLSSRVSAGEKPSVIMKSEFIYTAAPFPSAHASTIVEVGNRLIAAWFGGTAEGNPDVGIWLSDCDGTRWSDPVQVANGIQPDGTRFPCWNPVLFQPSYGPLLLFYKVGPNPREWWGMVRVSTDSGSSWSSAMQLPKGIMGPIRAKPVELADGTLLAGSSTEHSGWVVHMERFRPLMPKDTMSGIRAFRTESLSDSLSWQATGALNDTKEFGAIQPTILVHSPNVLQILCRSQQGLITQAWSDDNGRIWGRMTATSLPNPNAGIDAIRLADGRFLLIYNPTVRGREKLALAVSGDGMDWRSATVLEDSQGEYSYPAMIQTRDGLVHITYTWRRERIKHVVIDSKQIKLSAN